MDRVEIFFDCSSPGTYLGFHRLVALRDEVAFDLVLRPIFIGGVFKKVNPGVFDVRATMPPRKEVYFNKDFKDWATFAGVTITWPHPAHPINSVKAMRGVTAAGRHGKLYEVARATFEAFFHDGADISQDDVLAGVCAKAGFDTDLYFREIAEESVKAELRDTTDELMDRGGFGSPTIFINGDDMYFGNDRMELVRATLTRAAPGAMGRKSA